MKTSNYGTTVLGVCFLTGVAAVVTVFADGPAAVTVVGLVSTNILALMGAVKAGQAHEETLKLTNGKLSEAVRDALTANAPERKED